MVEVEFTLLLQQAAGGCRDSADRVFTIVYDQLRSLAARQMAMENPSLTLQATALVHEVWVRLLGTEQSSAWNDRQHFLATAAQAMRRILVDSARARQRQKRGGGQQRVELHEGLATCDADEELILLDESLEQLAAVEPRKASLVNLRYFGGLTMSEAAQYLGVSLATAERDWTFARAWLRAKIESAERRD